jgi:peptidoglycan/LPS O-acetylase OafA/YrhL
VTSSRINYLDGLRGLLAIIVFFHHFLYAFAPDIIFGGSYTDFLSKNPYSLKRLVALTPLNFFFNPGAAILFFFILSGYVQTRSYFETNNFSILQKSFIKRYFRLAIPTVAVVVLVYVFHRLHLIRNELIPPNELSGDWIKSQLPDTLNFSGALLNGIFDSFAGNSKYYQILWTMSIEIANSYLVLILAMATHNLSNRRWFFLLWLLTQLFLTKTYNGAAFTVGMLLASLYHKSATFDQIFSRLPVKLACWIIGLYFGTYPYTGYLGSTAKSVYSLISFFDDYIHLISYLIGVCFMFCALLYSPGVQRLLTSKTLSFFGNISYMFYLVHLLLIFSFSSWMHVALSNSTSHTTRLWINGLSSFAIITAVSYILYRLIDRPTLNLCNKYTRKIFGI